jgi:hypothetical protein
MKLRLQNYAVIMVIENRCIKFNNNRINTVQRYDIAQSLRFLHRMVQRLPQYNLTISNHRHIKQHCQRK